MAVTGEIGQSGANEASAPRAAPTWVVPLYLTGLVLVYLGERVLATWEPHLSVTGVGVAAVVIATALRFAPRFRAGGERQGIENLLAILSVVGLVGLALYALTTDWGLDLIGTSTANPETRQHVVGILTVLWVSLILISIVPMVFTETALYPMRRALLPESRRARLAATNGLTLALAAIYGALFVYAAADVGATVDYSYFKTSKPSDSTRRIAESLPEPVTVVAFFPEVNEARNEVEHYLRDLAKGIPTLKIEIKDHLLVPKLATEMHVTQDGAIVLKRGQSTEMLVIGTDMKDARPKLKTLDADFQEKLLKLARASRNAYLTAGHGELSDSHPGDEETGRSARILKQLLQKQNYNVKELGMGQGLGTDVPKDADVVLVLGPAEPFAVEEIASLQRYADNGGHLLIAVDPDALSEKDLINQGVETREPGEPGTASRDAGAPLAAHDAGAKPKAAPKPVGDAGAAAAHADAGAPVDARPIEVRLSSGSSTDRLSATLDALAAIAGLQRVPGILANENDHLRRRFNDSDNTLLLTNSFSSHASVSTLSRNSSRAAIVAFGAGALESKPGATGADFVVRSRFATFPDRNGNYTTDPDETRQVYNMAAAVSIAKKTPPAKPPGDKKNEKSDKKTPEGELRAFVIGDADAFSDVVLANVVANQVLFVDAVRWLTGEESFAGQQTTEEDVRIEHTKQKDQIWFYATIFGAPAVVLGMGVLYSRRSRRSRPRGGRS